MSDPVSAATNPAPAAIQTVAQLPTATVDPTVALVVQTAEHVIAKLAEVQKATAECQTKLQEQQLRFNDERHREAMLVQREQLTLLRWLANRGFVLLVAAFALMAFIAVFCLVTGRDALFEKMVQWSLAAIAGGSMVDFFRRLLGRKAQER